MCTASTISYRRLCDICALYVILQSQIYDKFVCEFIKIILLLQSIDIFELMYWSFQILYMYMYIECLKH